RGVRQVGVRTITARSATMRELFFTGVPFLMFAITAELQPNIDALYMSKLVPDDVVGWLSAARRLVGVLVQPASVLITALYPTLCRLRSEDHAAYLDTASSALRNTMILAAPLALGTAFFPEIGVMIFGRDKFGPA